MNKNLIIAVLLTLASSLSLTYAQTVTSDEGTITNTAEETSIVSDDSNIFVSDEEVSVDGMTVTNDVELEGSDDADFDAEFEEMFGDDIFAEDEDLFADEEDLFADDSEEIHGAAEEVSFDESFDTWGFDENADVTVTATDANSATLTAPAVVDGLGSQVTIYKVVYSTESMANPSFGSDVVLEEKVFNFDIITGTTVDLELDNLTEGLTYYAVVVPMNNADVAGQESSEVSFETAAHEAAPVEIENVSYTFDDKNVNMKWTSAEGAANVEVYVRSEDEADFTKIGTAAMADGTYVFPVAKSGNYIAKLVPTDESGNPVGQEKLQTVKVTVAQQPIEAVPAVGPATNLIIAFLILASLSYVALRFKRS